MKKRYDLLSLDNSFRCSNARSGSDMIYKDFMVEKINFWHVYLYMYILTAFVSFRI